MTRRQQHWRSCLLTGEGIMSNLLRLEDVGTFCMMLKWPICGEKRRGEKEAGGSQKNKRPSLAQSP